MKKYTVYLDYTSSIAIRIEANSKKEARQIAIDRAGEPELVQTAIDNLQFDGAEYIEED